MDIDGPAKLYANLLSYKLGGTIPVEFRKHYVNMVEDDALGPTDGPHALLKFIFGKPRIHMRGTTVDYSTQKLTLLHLRILCISMTRNTHLPQCLYIESDLPRVQKRYGWVNVYRMIGGSIQRHILWMTPIYRARYQLERSGYFDTPARESFLLPMRVLPEWTPSPAWFAFRLTTLDELTYPTEAEELEEYQMVRYVGRGRTQKRPIVYHDIINRNVVALAARLSWPHGETLRTYENRLDSANRLFLFSDRDVSPPILRIWFTFLVDLARELGRPLIVTEEYYHRLRAWPGMHAMGDAYDRGDANDQLPLFIPFSRYHAYFPPRRINGDVEESPMRWILDLFFEQVPISPPLPPTLPPQPPPEPIVVVQREEEEEQVRREDRYNGVDEFDPDVNPADLLYVDSPRAPPHIEEDDGDDFNPHARAAAGEAEEDREPMLLEDEPPRVRPQVEEEEEPEPPIEEERPPQRAAPVSPPQADEDRMVLEERAKKRKRLVLELPEDEDEEDDRMALDEAGPLPPPRPPSPPPPPPAKDSDLIERVPWKDVTADGRFLNDDIIVEAGDIELKPSFFERHRDVVLKLVPHQLILSGYMGKKERTIQCNREELEYVRPDGREPRVVAGVVNYASLVLGDVGRSFLQKAHAIQRLFYSLDLPESEKSYRKQLKKILNGTMIKMHVSFVPRPSHGLPHRYVCYLWDPERKQWKTGERPVKVNTHYPWQPTPYRLASLLAPRIGPMAIPEDEEPLSPYPKLFESVGQYFVGEGEKNDRIPRNAIPPELPEWKSGYSARTPQRPRMVIIDLIDLSRKKGLGLGGFFIRSLLRGLANNDIGPQALLLDHCFMSTAIWMDSTHNVMLIPRGPADANEILTRLTDGAYDSWLERQKEFKNKDIRHPRIVKYYEYLEQVANRFSQNAENMIHHPDIFDIDAPEILHFPEHLENAAITEPAYQYVPDLNPDPSIADNVKLSYSGKTGFQKLKENWPIDQIRFDTDLFWATPLAWHVARCRRFLQEDQMNIIEQFAQQFIIFRRDEKKTKLVAAPLLSISRHMVLPPSDEEGTYTGFNIHQTLLEAIYMHYTYHNQRKRKKFESIETEEDRVGPVEDEPLIGPPNPTIYRVFEMNTTPIVIQLILAFMVDQCRVNFDCLAIDRPVAEKWMRQMDVDDMNDILVQTEGLFSPPYPNFKLSDGEAYIMIPQSRNQVDLDDLLEEQTMPPSMAKKRPRDTTLDPEDETRPSKERRFECKYCGKTGASLTDGVILVCSIACYDGYYTHSDD